ncbi:MAG: hypothetical protein KME31_13015 [Tolypothrix carrinoi HA7290-LM1]|nr:hypothetical protein [Tolypothrix carrinoi HA7290-LM1]
MGEWESGGGGEGGQGGQGRQGGQGDKETRGIILLSPHLPIPLSPFPITYYPFPMPNDTFC